MTPLIVLILRNPTAFDFRYPDAQYAFAGLLFSALMMWAPIVRTPLRLRQKTRDERWWRCELTSVIAAAPFGLWTGLFFLAMSVIGVFDVALAPESVDYFDAPIAAILALGFLIPLLVLALALVRDIVRLLLTFIIFLPSAYGSILRELRYLPAVSRRHRSEGKPYRWFQSEKLELKKLWALCTTGYLRGLTGLGFFVLAGLILMPWFSSGMLEAFKIRTKTCLPEQHC